MLQDILKFLAAIWTLISNRQLLNAGKAEAENDVFKANEEARQTAKQVVKEVNTLPSDNVSYKLCDKYSRD